MSDMIDAVITWVDGNDPAHRRKLEDYLAGLGRARPSTADPTRFSDDGELGWCLASIVRFAPWFRRLYIVTDEQRPSLLDSFRGTAWESRVRLVDHRELFEGFDQYLPTFNSRSISSLFWRIPGIAERYVYFNDDFSLLHPVRPSDFFRGDAVVVRGRWQANARYSPAKRLVHALGLGRGRTDQASEGQAQELSARLAGFERRHLRLLHCPYPFRRSTLADFFRERPDALWASIRYPLRDALQPRPESLATHLEIAAGRAEFEHRSRLVHLKPAQQANWRLRAKLRKAEDDANTVFACVQSLDKATPIVRERLLAWFNARIGTLQAALDADVSFAR